jgi:hypothetical protein
MTNKECCAQAINCKFVTTSTNFWKGVQESGLSPQAWLEELYLDRIYLEIEENEYNKLMEQKALIQELCFERQTTENVDLCPQCGAYLYGERGVDEDIICCSNYCGYCRTL